MAAALVLAGCASDSPKPVASIGLALTVPKGLLDVDRVRLYVYDAEAVTCKGATITVPVNSVDRVFELGLEKTCNSNRSWCGTGTLEKNPDRVLTFYVEGRFEAKKGGFTGCVQRAVDQDPLQIEMKAQPLIEGVKCGDLAVGYGETCDPGMGVVDEACDGNTCQTKEVFVANRKATDGFFRGRPGRKTSIGIRWMGDRFYSVWSDQATNGGNDGPNEITVRRMSEQLITQSAPLVLIGGIRLPELSVNGGAATSNPSAKRGTVDTAPVMTVLPGNNLLFAFLRDGQLFTVAADAAFKVASADVPVTSGPGQSAPHVAANASGDALIVFVEGGAAKAVLRRADGTLGAPQTLSSGGTASRPRVASVGADYVVVWSDGADIKLRRVGADGAPKGGESVVNEAKTAGTQDQPDVAGFASGEFLVVWRDGAGDVGADIRVQKYDKAGARTGTEIGQVLNDVVKDGDQDQPVVAAGVTPLNARFYLVAWRTTNNVAARFVKADEPGFLVSHAGATTSEFNVGVAPAPRSSPAVAIGGGTAPFCAIAWSEDAETDHTGDDDRVRVRRLPMPDAPM